ncbi:Paraslipin domain protein [Lyticum sinuosum]|uniref:Paraslipin domain protein n=1 Tax=Lyticum sinuosum TaxID=1332059 RepID=A0AAE4VLR3_9RICK|nr:Paraslipin domain protein [Lyticum sinuosum]
MDPIVIIFIIIGIICTFGFKIVPQQQVWIIERFGKYNLSLEAGLSFIIPFIDKVAYKHTMKERAISVTEQAAITKDNVTLMVDGMIYVKIINPVDASYGVENPYYAATQLAQTSVRSAIGKLTMDTTFEEREILNTQIVSIINDAAKAWGIQCMRYEIRDIKPPTNVLRAMETQVAAERQKRAEILESEGKKQSMVNIAEGKKVEIVLASEANMTQRINQAKGEGEAIINLANSNAVAIESIARAMHSDNGYEAVNMRLADNYINAFSMLAKQNNTMIIPTNPSDIASIIGQATAIISNIRNNKLNNYHKVDDLHKGNNKKPDNEIYNDKLNQNKLSENINIEENSQNSTNSTNIENTCNATKLPVTDN